MTALAEAKIKEVDTFIREALETALERGALPGERVIVKQTARSRHFDEGTTVEVLSASADRGRRVLKARPPRSGILWRLKPNPVRAEPVEAFHSTQ